MEPFEERLGAELSALRPSPRPEFAAALDERAAAGFPRRGPARSNPLTGAFAWLRALPPRRLAFSAAGTALAAVAVVAVLVGTQGTRTDSGGGSNLLGDVQYFDQPKSAAPAPSAAAAPESSAAEEGTSGPEVSGAAGGRGYSAATGNREIERSAELVLGAEAGEVGGDAAKVFDVVHAHRGIVLDSSTTEGGAGAAEARFELLIPSAKLGDAMADLSGIAEVRSRHEATADITAPTVGAHEHLRDSRARIDGLLAQLATATDEGERETVEAELRGERSRAAALRSRLADLRRRANLSRVSVRIESGEAAVVGDALADAGRILGVAAAVAVVGLAILAPFALIALLAWLANRTRLRRARERALT